MILVINGTRTKKHPYLETRMKIKSKRKRKGSKMGQRERRNRKKGRRIKKERGPAMITKTLLNFISHSIQN